MCGQIAPQSPVEIFVQKKTHLGRGENVLTRFFQESDDLLALYAREPVEKLLDRIARFQVNEKTLRRDASSGKNGSPPRISGFCETIRDQRARRAASSPELAGSPSFFCACGCLRRVAPIFEDAAAVRRYGDAAHDTQNTA